MQNKNGFTLAEVLITLVIIGVIAAITVPVVMANHKKTETAAKLKKFYSTLSNAVRLSEIESGNQSYEWGVYREADGTGSHVGPSYICSDYNSMKTFYETYLLNHMSYVKVSKMSDNAKYFNQIDIQFKDLSNNSAVVYLNDGSLFYGDECPMSIVYDVNGEKGPNKMGRDLFQFNIFTEKLETENDYLLEKIPHVNTNVWGWSDTSFTPGIYEREQNRDYVLETCRESGLWCSHLLEIDSWEFKNDYPKRLN